MCYIKREGYSIEDGRLIKNILGYRFLPSVLEGEARSGVGAWENGGKWREGVGRTSGTLFWWKKNCGAYTPPEVFVKGVRNSGH